MEISAAVRVVSRRMVRPLSTNKEDVEVIHLTPWDLSLISIDYIKKGIVLPEPPAGNGGEVLVDALATSLARALGRFYPFAGRLAAEVHEEDEGTVTLSLRCTGEGAELVHAAAPWVAVADIAMASLPVASALYPLDGALGADAALSESPLPLVAVQVTELADGVFVGMSMNHAAGDGASFWHLLSTWSEIHCGGQGDPLSTPAPVFKRWFVKSSPVPIPLPFRKLHDIVRRRFDDGGALLSGLLHECVFTFSAASVEKLRKRVSSESASETTVSSLHAVLAHLWRAVCRARCLPPQESTSYTLVAGIRGLVDGIPPGYVGNAMAFGRAEATVGEIEDKGLGWTAWILNRAAAAAAFDEEGMRASLERWVREPSFSYTVGSHPSSPGNTGLVSGERDLAALDVFGNDFGWGKPVAVRSGPGNKADGKVAVFEGPERGGSISLEVCLVHDVLARLVADEEFMDAVGTRAGAT